MYKLEKHDVSTSVYINLRWEDKRLSLLTRWKKKDEKE